MESGILRNLCGFDMRHPLVGSLRSEISLTHLWRWVEGNLQSPPRVITLRVVHLFGQMQDARERRLTAQGHKRVKAERKQQRLLRIVRGLQQELYLASERDDRAEVRCPCLDASYPSPSIAGGWQCQLGTTLLADISS